MHKLLSKDDYINVAVQLSNTSVVDDLVNFILYLLLRGNLLNLYARRGRRLMSEIIAKTCVTPESLFVTGLRAKSDDRDFIGGGGFGQVFKGELRGKLVALKVLHKRSNVVSCLSSLTVSRRRLFEFDFSGTFIERHSCGDP